jgi:hypothetical protein
MVEEDYSLCGRTLEQFGEVGVHFCVVAQGEGDPGLFGPRSASAADDVEDEALFHGRHVARRTGGAHVQLDRK